jgi:hypothetical protein
MSADYSSSSSFMEPGSFSKDWTGISCFQVHIAHIDSIIRTLPSIPAEKSIELSQEWAENKVE